MVDLFESARSGLYDVASCIVPPSVVFPMSFASGERVSLCVRQSRPNLAQRRGSSVARVSEWVGVGRLTANGQHPTAVVNGQALSAARTCRILLEYIQEPEDCNPTTTRDQENRRLLAVMKASTEGHCWFRAGDAMRHRTWAPMVVWLRASSIRRKQTAWQAHWPGELRLSFEWIARG